MCVALHKLVAVGEHTLCRQQAQLPVSRLRRRWNSYEASSDRMRMSRHHHVYYKRKAHRMRPTVRFVIAHRV